MRDIIVFLGGDERTAAAAEVFENAGFEVRFVGVERYESSEKARTGAPLSEKKEEDGAPGSGEKAGTGEPLSEKKEEDGAPGSGETEIRVPKGACAVLPTPCSKDGQTLFAPFAETPLGIPEVREALRSAGIVVGGGAKKFFPEAIDLLEREDFKILNAVPSAEGAVAVAIEATDITVSGSKCVVVGFGKIGKRLSSLLRAFGADVTATARKATDFAEARAAGIRVIQTKDVSAALAEADIVFNTVPFAVIGEKELAQTEKTAVFIELASAPGGIDARACERLGRKYVSARGLPGRFSPKSAGAITAEAIMNIVAEKRR